MNRLLLFFTAPLIALFHQLHPFTVYLDTEKALTPLYIASFDMKDSTFGKGYASSLEKVLCNDFDWDGHSRLVTASDDVERLCSGEGLGKEASCRALQQRGIYYLVKVSLQGKGLSAKIVDVLGRHVYTIDNMPLTGLLPSDRRQIHLLHDKAHEKIFGSSGIAATRLLFACKGGSGGDSGDIWLCDYDGANGRAVTQGAGLCVTPTFMPPKVGHSSGSFFFVSYKMGLPKIYSQALVSEDKVAQRVTTIRGNQLMPALSPQRDKLAFVCDVTGNPDLFIADYSPEEGVKGKPRQIFAARLATQASPSFSPDGKRVAFVSNKDGSPRVYIIDIPAEGAALKNIKPQLITKHYRESTAPSWSPDGKKLVYSSLVDGVRQIVAFDLQNNTETVLTHDAANKENPSWAPDSFHIVYNTYDKEKGELFILNLNDPHPISVAVDAPGQKRFVVWEPRSPAV